MAKAIKILRTLPVSKQEETDEYEIADGLVYKILTLRKQLESLEEEERILNLDMNRVQVFGDFSLR